MATTKSLISKQEFIARGGLFTISDDSHGVSHVGTNYGRLLRFIENVEISPITFLKKGLITKDPRFPGVSTNTISIDEIKEHQIFA